MEPGDSFFERIVRRVGLSRAVYDTQRYWELRASGAGRTSVMWPNPAFNDLLDRDEWRLVEERLPAARDSVLDLGCGVGRMSMRLASKFRSYTGVDLGPMIDEARRQNTTLASDFIVATVSSYGYPAEAFDFVLSIACLPFACSSDGLEVVARRIVQTTRPGGRILLIEPFHRSRLLTRGCRATPREIIDVFESHGAKLSSWTGIVFVPARIALSERPFAMLPRLTRLVYDAGEAIVRLRPRLLGDYSVIALDRA